jgi:hypothetical protein
MQGISAVFFFFLSSDDTPRCVLMQCPAGNITQKPFINRLYIYYMLLGVTRFIILEVIMTYKTIFYGFS